MSLNVVGVIIAIILNARILKVMKIKIVKVIDKFKEYWVTI